MLRGNILYILCLWLYFQNHKDSRKKSPAYYAGDFGRDLSSIDR